jgi:hypothetical protein
MKFIDRYINMFCTLMQEFHPTDLFPIPYPFKISYNTTQNRELLTLYQVLWLSG